MKLFTLILLLCILCISITQNAQADETLMSVITDLRILAGEPIPPLHPPPVSLGSAINSMKRLSGLGGWIVSSKYIGNGSVMPQNIIANTGQEFVFTFTPDDGWQVKDVYLDGIPVSEPKETLTVTVTGDHSIEVSFVMILPEQFTANELSLKTLFATYKSGSVWNYDTVTFQDNQITIEPQGDSGILIESNYSLDDTGFLSFFIPSYGNQYLGVFSRKEGYIEICWQNTIEKLYFAMETGACASETERWFFEETAAQDFIEKQ